MSWAQMQREGHLTLWDKKSCRGRVSGLVSIIVPVFNQPQLTECCVRSLFKAQADALFEVICVDNGSDLDTQKMLQRLACEYSGLHIIRNETNLNFALGCNLGFVRSNGDLVVFLNNDTEVTDGWLDHLVRGLKQGDCFAVQPQLRYPDGSLQCMGVVFSDKSVLGYPIYAQMAPQNCIAEKPRQFKAVTAACMALRAVDFASVNGFDAAFINGQEDVDLCLRLHEKTGKCAGYVPESIVIHHESKSEGRGRWISQNRQVFVHRWRNKVQPDDVSHYRRDGFTVEKWVGDGHDAVLGTRIYRPVLALDRAVGLGYGNSALRKGDCSSAMSAFWRASGRYYGLTAVIEQNLELVKRRWSRDKVHGGDRECASLSVDLQRSLTVNQRIQQLMSEVCQDPRYSVALATGEDGVMIKAWLYQLVWGSTVVWGGAESLGYARITEDLAGPWKGKLRTVLDYQGEKLYRQWKRAFERYVFHTDY